MESNAIMIKPEALLCFMVYSGPDRQHAMPLLGNIWVDKKTALGNRYELGSRHTYTSMTGLQETTHFVVAMLPLIQRVPNPHDPAGTVLHVTVYYARLEDWPLFVPVEDMTPGQIRAAMLQLPEN